MGTWQPKARKRTLRCDVLGCGTTTSRTAPSPAELVRVVLPPGVQLLAEGDAYQSLERVPTGRYGIVESGSHRLVGTLGLRGSGELVCRDGRCDWRASVGARPSLLERE